MYIIVIELSKNNNFIGGPMLTKIFYHFYDYKKSTINFISLILLALVLVILGLLSNFSTNNFTILLEIMLYPFKFISNTLKSLALTGAVGNALALTLFGLISLIPIIIYLYCCYKNKKCIEIIDLFFYIIISILTGVIIYLLINPTLITSPLDSINFLHEEIENFLQNYRKIIYLGLILVLILVVILYLVYRFLIKNKEQPLNLFKAAKFLLVIQRIYYTFLFIFAFYIIPIMIKNEVNNLSNIQYGKGHEIVLIIFEYFSYYLMFFLISRVLRNLHDLLVNYTNEILFSIDNVMLLKNCSSLFLIYFIANLAYQLINNVYQLIFKNNIQNLKLSIDFPFTSLTLTLVFYLLALVMRQSYEIYTENSLTI